MIILMPVKENKGINSKISSHFGKTPYWAIFNTETQDFRIEKKVSKYGEGGCVAVDEVINYSPDIIYVLDMGFGAIQRCVGSQIKVKTGNFMVAKEVIDNLENLYDLKRGCYGEIN